MNPYECYIEYIALKKHFSLAKFDYFRYNGKVKLSIEAYNKRNDKYTFEKLSSRADVRDILLSHISENPDIWVGDIQPDSPIHKDFLKRRLSLEYSFKEEIKCDWPDCVQSMGEHPVLLKKFMRKEVSKETMVIVNSIIHYAPYWNKVIDDDLIWPKINFNLKKYSPFLKFDKAKYKVIFDTYANTANTANTEK